MDDKDARFLQLSEPIREEAKRARQRSEKHSEGGDVSPCHLLKNAAGQISFLRADWSNGILVAQTSKLSFAASFRCAESLTKPQV